MDWNEFVYQCWGDHAHNPVLVAEMIKEKSRELKDPAALNSFVPLLVHVYGEHMGDWQQGIDLLKAMENSLQTAGLTPDLMALLKRSEAMPNLGINPEASLQEFSNSDQTRILATASSAYLGHEKITLASQFLEKALAVGTQLPPKDPAMRALAVASNGIASGLETREHLSTLEIDLMIDGALAARKFWEMAGTWKEVERAEYRLAHCHLKAKMAAEALTHAELCLYIVEQNGGDSFEKFFAHEALAYCRWALEDVEKARQEVILAEELFGKIPAENRQWCQEGLNKLKKLTAPSE